MICSLKQSFKPVRGTDIVDWRRYDLPTKKVSFLTPQLPRKRSNAIVSLSRPLHVSSTEGFGFSNGEGEKEKLVRCEAYEADRSNPVDAGAAGSEAAQRAKIGIYFATWWALNVVFNIYNKKVLNAYPYPWLTSTLSLAAGSLIMLVSWATRIAEAPKTDFDFWKTLFPVSGSFFFVFFPSF